MTEDLVAFLRARLHEDEQVALGCVTTSEQAGLRRGHPLQRWKRSGAQITSGGIAQVGQTWARPAAHIIRHDPARVLAEVGAKLRIVDECERTLAYEEDGHWLAEQTLRLLARPYRDYPDYRPEWAPAS